jgi:hypothetical protein
VRPAHSGAWPKYPRGYYGKGDELRKRRPPVDLRVEDGERTVGERGA